MAECKPTTTEIGSPCQAIGQFEVDKAKSDDGTAEDIWAIPETLMPPTSPPQPAPWNATIPVEEPLVLKAPDVEGPGAAKKKKEEDDGDDDAAAAAAKAAAL